MPAKKSGGWWLWLLLVPAILLGLVFAIAAANPNRLTDPGKARDLSVYRGCMEQLESLDRGRSSAAPTLAAMCERFRSEFVEKWGRAP